MTTLDLYALSMPGVNLKYDSLRLSPSNVELRLIYSREDSRNLGTLIALMRVKAHDRGGYDVIGRHKYRIYIHDSLENGSLSLAPDMGVE